MLMIPNTVGLITPKNTQISRLRDMFSIRPIFLMKNKHSWPIIWHSSSRITLSIWNFIEREYRVIGFPSPKVRTRCGIISINLHIQTNRKKINMERIF